MKKYFTLFLTLLFFVLSKAQAQNSLNMTNLASWDPGGGMEFNDIWGHVDGFGNEYAIIGSLSKIHIIRIHSNNTLTQVAEFSPGSSTIWRDFKIYKDTLYAVADESPGTEGLAIYDLSNLPTSVTLVSQSNSVFARAHNIYIEEASGRLYVTGSNTQSKGLHIYDLTAHPDTILASVDLLQPNSSFVPGYAHDIFVKNDTVYASHGYDGFYVWDMKDPTNPILVGNINTGGYNHSSWAAPDGDIIYYAEEVPIGLPMGVLDISKLRDNNPNNDQIDKINTFKFPLLAPNHTNNRPHNPFVIGDSLYVSYYHDGVQVFNVSDPMNPSQDSYFDTEPGNSSYSGYTGAWGCYPFLPSGKILVSDINNGLFVTEMQPLAPLPVELEKFSAELRGEKVLLQWTTLSEINNDFFEIEKSTDGRDFEVLEKIAGAGNSTEPIAYEFWDRHPAQGKNYYRLRQVDFDGKSTFSEIEFIQFNRQDIKIYPTVVTNDAPINLELPNDLDGGVVRILNQNGQEVFHQKLPKGNRHFLTLDHLENGLYVLYFQGKAIEHIDHLTILRSE